MNDLKKIIKPSNGVFLIAVGLFLFWSLVELSKLSTYSETPSDRNNYVLYLFRWPDDVAKKIKNKYLEIRLPYDEQLYRTLSTTTKDEVFIYKVANAPDYMVVTKKGFFYSAAKASSFIVFGTILFFLNFYLLALILYWLGRGVRHLLKRQ